MPSLFNENFPSIWKVEIVNNIVIDIKKVDGIGHDLANGIYTTLKIYPGKKVHQFKQHMERLVESARLSGFDFKLSEYDLRKSLNNVLEQFQTESLKVQILVFPTETELVIFFVFNKAPVISAEGSKAITRNLYRSNPKAKRTDFILQQNEEKNGLSKDVEEILMVDDKGSILEGMSSNFFGVYKNEIWTAADGVLSGTTRKTILNIIDILRIPINFHGFPFDRLGLIEESFISSVSRGVLPIVFINDQPVGNGKPGKTTLLIKQKYDELITQELEEL